VRHTGENLKDLIEQVLQGYELSLSNINTVTTDNGSNFVKAVSLCKKATSKDASKGKKKYGEVAK
jgi:hypothetical protein